jgi:hypothetical protein
MPFTRLRFLVVAALTSIAIVASGGESLAAGGRAHSSVRAAAGSAEKSSHGARASRPKKPRKNKRADRGTPRARKAPGHASGVTHASAPHPRSNRCENCDRDEHGKILRSRRAKKAFESATGYPHGRPGYVIDHIRPLACGGRDVPSNMQWQTKSDARAKDKKERAGCH